MTIRPENDGGVFESTFDDFVIPHNLTRIFSYERKTRRGLYSEASDRLEDMLVQYVGPQEGQSFHSIELESGRKLLLHVLQDHPGIGPTHHVVVNQESGDRKHVSYWEYAIPRNFNALGYRGAEINRSDPRSAWNISSHNTVSLLEKHTEKFILIRGKRSPLVRPPVEWRPNVKEAEHMVVSQRLRQLLTDLNMLSPGTHEENVSGNFY